MVRSSCCVSGDWRKSVHVVKQRDDDEVHGTQAGACPQTVQHHWKTAVTAQMTLSSIHHAHPGPPHPCIHRLSIPLQHFLLLPGCASSSLTGYWKYSCWLRNQQLCFTDDLCGQVSLFTRMCNEPRPWTPCICLSVLSFLCYDWEEHPEWEYFSVLLFFQHTCEYTQTHTHTHACTNAHTHTHMHAHTHTHTHTHRVICCPAIWAAILWLQEKPKRLPAPEAFRNGGWQLVVSAQKALRNCGWRWWIACDCLCWWVVQSSATHFEETTFGSSWIDARFVRFDCICSVPRTRLPVLMVGVYCCWVSFFACSWLAWKSMQIYITIGLVQHSRWADITWQDWYN